MKTTRKLVNSVNATVLYAQVRFFIAGHGIVGLFVKPYDLLLAMDRSGELLER